MKKFIVIGIFFALFFTMVQAQEVEPEWMISRILQPNETWQAVTFRYTEPGDRIAGEFETDGSMIHFMIINNADINAMPLAQCYFESKFAFNVTIPEAPQPGENETVIVQMPKPYYVVVFENPGNNPAALYANIDWMPASEVEAEEEEEEGGGLDICETLKSICGSLI